MLHIYLDTALLANSNYGTDATTVQELIDRVNHFSLMLTEGLPLRIVVADDAEDILGIEYPNHQSINDFLDMVGLSHVYSANDLLKQYQSILDRGVRPAGVESFEVYSTSAFAATPQLPAGLGPVGLVAESERVFTTVAVQGAETSWWVGSAMNGTADQQFQISATVEKASKDPSPLNEALAFSFTRSAKTLVCFEDLVSFSAAKLLWRNADSADDLHLAISLGALAILRGANQESSSRHLKSFSIGSGFLQTLDARGCAKGQKYSSTTFQLCAQIVADNGTAVVKSMGKPHQEVRPIDQATAWRSHITGGGLGLRLMYWQTSTHVEFANVEVKKIIYIDQGDAKATEVNIGGLI